MWLVLVKEAVHEMTRIVREYYWLEWFGEYLILSYYFVEGRVVMEEVVQILALIAMDSFGI